MRFEVKLDRYISRNPSQKLTSHSSKHCTASTWEAKLSEPLKLSPEGTGLESGWVTSCERYTYQLPFSLVFSLNFFLVLFDLYMRIWKHIYQYLFYFDNKQVVDVCLLEEKCCAAVTWLLFSLLKMLMVDAQKLSRSLIRQNHFAVFPFGCSGRSYPSNVTDDLLRCYTLRLGRNLGKGKVVLRTCFFFHVSKCRWTNSVRRTLSYLSQGRYVQVLVSFYLYDFEDQLLGFISGGFRSHMQVISDVSNEINPVIWKPLFIRTYLA